MKDFINQPKVLLYCIIYINERIIKATNKKPCKPPTMVTASGIPAKYLNGMATNNKTRQEMPSTKAVFLNQLNVFVDLIIKKLQY